MIRLRRLLSGIALLLGIGIPTALWPLYVLGFFVAVLFLMAAYVVGCMIEDARA